MSSVGPRRESGECEARKSNRRSGAPRTANVDGAARGWKDHGAGTGKRARMLASHWRRRSESAKTGQLQTHPHCLRDLRLSHSSVFVDSSARSQQQPASSVAQFGFFGMPDAQRPQNRYQSSTTVLALAALGVVFGDIGTSPLYTLKTVLSLAGDKADPPTTLGVLSLIVWTLIVITSVKYVSIAMRVDNDGEGGILALMSLLGVKRKVRPAIVSVSAGAAVPASTCGAAVAAWFSALVRAAPGASAACSVPPKETAKSVKSSGPRCMVLSR